MTIRASLILQRYHAVYLLLLVLQVSGQPQPGTSGPYGRQIRPNQVPAVIIGMLIFTLLFSMIACCICYKYTSTSPPGTSSDYDEAGRGGGVGWNRRTSRGLEKDVINFFPSFIYSQVKGQKIGKGGVECAICLNEFEDEETLRLMPPCSHAFHADCIDVWLSSRSTCPVCRANLAPKPGSDQRFLYPFVRPHTNQDMDLESGNTTTSVLESPDMRLLDGLTRSNNNEANRPPRSKSTGSSNWQIRDILFPRSHSTGHYLVPLGENLDRFTLQLPEEVRRQLSQRTLPQARSSRQGYRSGSVGSQRRGFPYGRRYNRRTISLSFSFSFQSASLQSEKSKDEESGEGSIERLSLRPETGSS
ncbi:RING-H2 finger protein ATL34 [Raphanus sativus]|uniref:RING-type E3 ubiquitin transferase n=1 Tax=Raphanus sativus TaxID=3726 RepID=A0A6J0KJA7_RAPSA|nr:RING-H2 finger protein ATL34 [Raphanus sativus]